MHRRQRQRHRLQRPIEGRATDGRKPEYGIDLWRPMSTKKTMLKRQNEISGCACRLFRSSLMNQSRMVRIGLERHENNHKQARTSSRPANFEDQLGFNSLFKDRVESQHPVLILLNLGHTYKADKDGWRHPPPLPATYLSIVRSEFSFSSSSRLRMPSPVSPNSSRLGSSFEYRELHLVP